LEDKDNFAFDLTKNINKKMKKSLSILAFAGMLATVACGPSAEETAAKEKRKQDSIAKADSVAAASVAVAAAAEKTKQDSISKAMDQAKTDSIAMAGTGKKGLKK
jgi:hypothetical protein